MPCLVCWSRRFGTKPTHDPSGWCALIRQASSLRVQCCTCRVHGTPATQARDRDLCKLWSRSGIIRSGSCKLGSMQKDSIPGMYRCARSTFVHTVRATRLSKLSSRALDTVAGSFLGTPCQPIGTASHAPWLTAHPLRERAELRVIRAGDAGRMAYQFGSRPSRDSDSPVGQNQHHLPISTLRRADPKAKTRL